MDVFGSQVSLWQVGMFVGVFSLYFCIGRHATLVRGKEFEYDNSVVFVCGVVLFLVVLIMQVVVAALTMTPIMEVRLFIEYSLAAIAGTLAGLLRGEIILRRQG